MTLKNLSKFLILLVFVCYWSVTFLFNTPDNYIRIQNRGLMNEFNSFFYQKWTFFAPPPTTNDRLYFTFYTKDSTEIKTFEVLENISILNKNNSIFNSEGSLISYSVNGMASSVIDAIIKQKEIYDELYRDSIDVNVNLKASLAVTDNLLKYSFGRSLMRYSKIVARKNIQSFDQIEYVKIKVSEIPIPKFSTIVSGVKVEKKEFLKFESKLLKLNV